MSSITYYDSGMIKIRSGGEELYADIYPDDIRETIKFLEDKGYIVIDANHVAYCHYVSGECPHCGRPAERPNA